MCIKLFIKIDKKVDKKTLYTDRRQLRLHMKLALLVPGIKILQSQFQDSLFVPELQLMNVDSTFQ